jgi:3-oxoacyl-(acyl-carrier-protein) synthase
MNRRRVKITGIGPVTPAGTGRDDFWSGILEPVSRVEKLEGFPVEAGPFAAAQVRDFQLERHLPGVPSKRVPRHTQFALAATALAAADAGISLDELARHEPVVSIGATLMDFGVINKGVDIILRKGPVNALPTSVPVALVSGIGAAISDLMGGITRTVCVQTACCSGLDAVGAAADAIAAGESDFAVCGGTEAPLHFHPMLELKLAGLAPGNPDQPERQCRPFDLWRTTGLMGEGACVLILEPESSPRPGYAYISGYGFASDPKGAVCAGLIRAMNLALANAGRRPDDIDCLSAWGPGHKQIDAAEVAACAAVLNGRLREIPASSIKGAVGNPLAAAGPMQVACSALGLRHGAVTPTVNWTHPDPECPLNLKATPRYLDHSCVLVNAHGLSGTNACLILERCT